MTALARRDAGGGAGRSWWNLYGFPVVLVAASILTVVAVVRGRPGSSTTDFISFYQSGRQYLAGADPYEPFDPNRGPNLNPPWVVAIMAQLCRAPLPLAVVMWWASSFACFFVAVILIARAVAPRQAVAIASLVLVTQAAYANLRLGQVAWQVMLLVTAAWLADRSRRPVLCGICVGLAAAWKPFLLVFAPYLVWRRDWRALSAMTTTMGLTILVGLLAVGVSGYESWFGMLQLVGWAGHPLNASLRGLLTRALTRASLAEQMTMPIIDAPAWLEPVWIGSVVAVAVIAAGRPDAMSLAGAGVVLLCVPFAWLKARPFGPALTVTVASCYTWGVCLLFASIGRATRSAPRRASSNSSVPKAPSASV